MHHLCQMSGGGYIIGEGQKFARGVVEFREKMKKYAIHNGFLFYYMRNTQSFIGLECEDIECDFYVKGSVCASNKAFYITECELKHNCRSVLRKYTHSFLDSKMVADCIVNDVQYNPSIRPRAIVQKFKINYGFDIPYKVALNARVKALVKIFGKDHDSFNKLKWYSEAVESTNPGTYFDLEVDPESNRFSRLFIAYGGAVAGFNYCVPAIYVDGCFGKSMYKGQILAATSKDGNKGMNNCTISLENIYPIWLIHLRILFFWGNMFLLGNRSSIFRIYISYYVVWYLICNQVYSLLPYVCVTQKVRIIGYISSGI